MDRKIDINGIDNSRIKSEDYAPIMDLDYRFFEYMQEGVIVSSIVRDKKGNIIDMVLKYANLAAYKQRKDLKMGLIEKSIKEIYTLEEANFDIEKADEVLKTGMGAKYETYRKKLGKYFSVTAFSPNEDTYITLTTDITAQKNAENKIKKERQKLLDIIEFLPDATFVINEKKEIIAWNKAIEEMTGVKSDDIIGKNDYAYSIPFYGYKRPIIIDLIFLKEKEIESKYQYVKREGNALYAEVYVNNLFGGKGAYVFVKASALYDSDGNLTGAIETVRDITQQKRAEMALIESEEKFRSTIEQSTDGIVIMDEKGSIIEWNKGMEIITGRKKEDELGKLIWDSQYGSIPEEKKTPELYEYIQGTIQEFLQTGKADWVNKLLDREVQRPDGKIRFIQSITYPIKTTKGIIIGSITRDITEVKESEEKFRTLADNISQLVWIADEKGNRSWYNKRWYDYTGTTLKEMEGKGWQKVHHPKYVQKVKNKLEEGFKKGKLWEDTFLLRGKNGNYRWFLLRVTPIKDENGHVLRWFGSNTDINELVETEDRLKYEQNLLNTVLNNIPVSVAVAEAPSGKLIRANDQFEKIWEQPFIPSKDIEAYSTYKGYHPDGRPYKADEWPLARSISKGEIVVREEIKLIFKEGKEKVLVVSSTPIKDENGQIILGVVIAADITGRIKAEESLKESESTFRSFFELAAVGMAMINPLNGRFVEVNDEFSRITGYGIEELYDKTFIDLTYPDDRPLDSENFKKLLNGEIQQYDTEKRYKRKDGQIIWVHVIVTLVRDSKGKPFRTIGIISRIDKPK